MENLRSTLLLFVLILCISACSKQSDNGKSQTKSVDSSSMKKQHDYSKVTQVRATLNPLSGSGVKGVVTFTKSGEGVKIVADIEGLSPGKHGIHIHEKGDCSAPDGSSAGPHFNPTQGEHGGHDSPNRHEGDMGNITAGNDGKAHLELIDVLMKFDGPESIIGRSVIVHEKEDDLKSQPAGNSGNRLACGIIEVLSQ